MAADTPKIVLTPQERSHYFNRRECVANEALKVGRSVDRRRISPNNLIFDCRVLSRNHALIWFENGKFYIKDTKSSNGTFVNENRLSASGEESGPVELKSRDVVQFGVNVNVDKKVTHGCIIATVKLFMNDVEIPSDEPPVQQVMQILMSALGREQELETKLASMQSVLNVARELATDSMIAIVKEDELMSRLEMLENQLQVYSRNASDDELKKQLAKAFEEKHKNELASKDSLRGILQEKLECVSKLNQLQRDYDKAEQECQKYRTLLEAAKEEHSQEVTKLSEQLRNSEKERKEIESKLMEEKKNLTASLESTQAEADFTKKQLDQVKSQLSETKEELVELRIAMETKRQREAKAITESTEEHPPGSINPPGTDIEGSLVPPGTEDPVGEAPDITPKEETKQLRNLDPLLKEKSPAPSPPSPFNRRETILAASWEDQPLPVFSETENDLKGKLVHLETELRISQGKVKLLEEQLGAVSATRHNRAEQTPFTEDMAVLAKKLSDSAITKGQIEILQQSLTEAENLIKELKVSQSSPPPDSNSDKDTVDRLNTEVRTLHENIASLENRLQSSEAECKRAQEDKGILEIELSVASERLSSEVDNNVTLKSQNDELTVRNEDLQRRVDELCATLKYQQQSSGITKVCESPSPSTSTTSSAPASVSNTAATNLDASTIQRQLEEERQHVRMLTLLALVSIGVALASWWLL